MLRVISRITFQKSNIKWDRNLIFFKTFKSQVSLFNSKDVSDVKGFSKAVLNVPDTPVGFAGAAKNLEYKNPEYFCYHVDSFGESMVELEKYRLPAPSNKKKEKINYDAI